MNITIIPAVGDTVTFRPARGDDITAGEAVVVGVSQAEDRTFVDLAIGEERRDGILVVASFHDLPVDVSPDGAFVETLAPVSKNQELFIPPAAGTIVATSTPPLQLIGSADTTAADRDAIAAEGEAIATSTGAVATFPESTS